MVLISMILWIRVSPEARHAFDLASGETRKEFFKKLRQFQSGAVVHLYSFKVRKQTAFHPVEGLLQKQLPY